MFLHDVPQTNLSNFTGTTYRNVSRSYYEFQQFYDAIIQNNPQTIVPALPLARTSAPTDEEDDRLVKIMLQRWLTRICEDPILIHEEELRSFIESDFGVRLSALHSGSHVSTPSSINPPFARSAKRALDLAC